MTTILNQKPYNYGIRKEKYLLDSMFVTNCLTKIPDRIKYTLENGTFTLKAGSVVIVPYGTKAPTLAIGEFLEGESNNNNFKIVDIQYKNNKLIYWCEVQNDISQNTTISDSRIRLLTVPISTSTNAKLFANMLSSSATTLPDDNNNYIWYQEANNKIVHINTSHTIDGILAFPIGEVKAGNGTLIDTIIKIFNGRGNIGGIHWIDKGVEGLIPYYRNKDKTLKSIHFVQTELTMSANRSSNTVNTINSILGNYQEDTGCIVPYQMLSNNYYYESEIQPNATNQYAIWYDTYNNIFKQTINAGVTWQELKTLKIGTGIITNGILTSSYNTTFQAADAQDLDGIWYKAPATIASNVSLNDANNNPLEVSLLNILPNDGEIYELTLSIFLTTGTTSGDYAAVMLASSLDNFAACPYYCTARTRGTGNANAAAYSKILVKGGGSIRISRNSSWAGTVRIQSVYTRKVR